MESAADVAELYSSDPQLKKEDVKAIEDWLETQPHLPELTELQTISFLHSCYYQLDAAKTTIENYFTFKTKSDLFKNVDEEMVRRVLASFFVALLPEKTPEGYVILLMKFIDPDPDKYVAIDHSKVLFVITSLYVHQYGPANGLIVVSDLKGFTLRHLFKMKISLTKEIMYFVQEAMPVRLKSIHHINCMVIGERFISIMRPFMKKETYKMIKFHHSMDTFFKFIPRECMPEDCGGTLPSILKLQETNLKNILDHWEFQKWHQGQTVDESKRVKIEKGFFSRSFN